MINTSKNIVIVLLIALAGYLLFIKEGKNTHTSSLIIEEIHDTIIKHDTVKLKELIPYEVIETKTDTFLKEGIYNFKDYEYKINDSLLTGTIFARSLTDPKIKIEYNVKSFEIKDSIVIQPQNNLKGLFYGGSLVVNPFATEVYFDAAKSFKNGNQLNFSIGRNFEAKRTVFKVGFLKKI